MKIDGKAKTVKAQLCLGMVAFVILLAPLTAAEPNNTAKKQPALPILIEPDQLQQKLSDKKLRVIDVRPEAEYTQGHIPGAVRVDVGDWKKTAFATNGLHDEKIWAKKIGPLGLQPGMQVVIYGSQPSDAARIWWLLSYVGVKQAAILNGGWQWWTKLERPTETTTPKISATKFQPDFQKDRVVEIESLKDSLSSDKLNFIDTRSVEEFNGGRIPQAAHLEWKDLLAGDGRFKSKTQLQRLFKERGIDPSKPAVCYCRSGGRASVDAFALELAGHPIVKVYMHGWSQWGVDKDAPVEK